MLPVQTKPILYIIVNNHFDLTWRRCWQRPFTFHGQTFVSYADLETWYMLDNLALAEQYPEYKFEAESVLVVRTFLERCPEKRAELQKLIHEGRFAITGSGEAIVDANMITGESLVRNFVDGLLWVEETFGQKTRMAIRNDAFGNSAQLPQILRGCEITWMTGATYSPAWNHYWRGLDGSTILTQSLPIAVRAGGCAKYVPCPICHGTGRSQVGECLACGGRGIEAGLRANLPGKIDPEALSGSDAVLILIMPEELLPNPALPLWANEMRKEYDVRFALEEDVLPHLQGWLTEVDHAPEDCLHPGLELNPNNSGCLVTRIQTKQTVRRQEYALQAVETLSAMAALKGHAYPKEDLKRIRQLQYITMFHDAITATHIDAAYTELEDIWREIDDQTSTVRAKTLTALACSDDPSGVVSVINPGGNPLTALCTATIPSSADAATLIDDQGKPAPIVAMRRIDDRQMEVDFVANRLPPLAARQYHVSPAAASAPIEQITTPVIENSRFRVQAGENGLVSVFDKSLQREILSTGDYRPGELILEHDEGSPWATLSADQHRIRLAPFTCLERVEKTAAWQRMVFSVETPREMGLCGKCLRAQLSVTLVEELNQVNFDLHADWDSFNYRLRVSMPVHSALPGKHVYEIPYGFITREPYEPTFGWAGANGDWPAINWAGVEYPGMSVALLNQGTPSYRIEPNTAAPGDSILLSLLRSPVIPTYLHEPEFYTMTGWDGMRDSGEHDFAFAIRAYGGSFAESSIVQDAEAFNIQPVVVQGPVNLPEMPAVRSNVARLSAIKWAEAGDGLVLRLVEFRGQGGEVEIHLPFAIRLASKVNLLERQDEPLFAQHQSIRLKLLPWEIATVKLSL